MTEMTPPPEMKNFSTLRVTRHPGLLGLLLISLIIYLPSLKGDFVFDDIPLVKDNPYIRDIGHVARFFTKGVWENTALEIDDDPRYLPMVLAPMMLNHALWGNNPFGYHIYALLLHLTATCLVYMLIRRLTGGSSTAATFGAALFALHPARVESVAWIIGSIEPLLTIFLLVAFLAHQTYTEKRKWRYLALSLACFQLALWSKETALTFPFAMMAHDLVYRKKIDRLVTSLHLALIAGYLTTRSLVLGGSGHINPFDLSQLGRVLDYSLGYSELLVFPASIPFYLKSPEHSVSSPAGVVAALVILAVIGFSWRAFDTHRRKDLLFALIWFAVFFWPAIVMMFYGDGYYYARWLYIPAIGISVLTATLYLHLTDIHPESRSLIAASAVFAICAYGFITWKEIPSWHDPETFYRKVVNSNPEGAAGYCQLGQIHFLRSDHATAEQYFQLCQKKAKKPDIKAEALVKLGTIRGMSNDIGNSVSYLQEALRLAPGNSEALTGLGNLALMQGQTTLAITYYDKALESRAGNIEATANLAMAYENLGQHERAAQIRRSIR